MLDECEPAVYWRLRDASGNILKRRDVGKNSLNKSLK